MVTTLLIVVLVSTGTVFLWGFLAPRSLWRALSSWSYGDPHLNEPTGIGYALYRVVAAIGIASMVVSGVLVYRVQAEAQPAPPVPATTAELLWGTPEPVVLNRVIKPLGSAPTGLVNQPILGYHGMTGTSRQPAYLFYLDYFDLPEAITANGLVGDHPSVGLVALDTAELVVRVAGDPQCFPHAVVVKESGSSVLVGVFYGRAMPDAKNPPPNLTTCNVLASGLNVSTLIPISLVEPLGDRSVRNLDGSPIKRVHTGK